MKINSDDWYQIAATDEVSFTQKAQVHTQAHGKHTVHCVCEATTPRLIIPHQQLALAELAKADKRVNTAKKEGWRRRWKGGGGEL